MSSPLLIVTLGPTGSGKSSLPDKVKTYLVDQRLTSDLKLDKKPESLLIDDLVETSTKYKSDVFNILRKHLNSFSYTNTDITEEKYTDLFFGELEKEAAAIAFGNFTIVDKKNITKLMSLIDTPSEVRNKFTKAYFDARNFYTCVPGLFEEIETNTQISPIPKKLNENCDSAPPKGSPPYKSQSCPSEWLPLENACSQVLTAKLKKNLELGKNIIFETTGSYFPFWLFEVYGKQLKKYKIIFAWTYVELEELKQRIKTRAKKQISQFYINNKELFLQEQQPGKSTELKGFGPRLPDVSTLNESVRLINQTFQELSTIRLLKTNTPVSQVREAIKQMCETCLTYMNEQLLTSFRNIQYLVFDNSSTSNPASVYDSVSTQAQTGPDYSYYTNDLLKVQKQKKLYNTQFPIFNATKPGNKIEIPGDMHSAKYSHAVKDFSFGGGRRTKLRKRKRNRKHTKNKRKKSVKRRIKRNRRKSKKKYN